MLIRKYERFDNYFMSLVRRAVDNSTDLRGAIKSLQSHVQDADDHVDANELVSRLAEV